MDRKQQLITAAAKIIQEEGMQKLTMEYLAQKVGVTKGGVLYHFDSKAQLLAQMNEWMLAQFEESIERFGQSLTGSCRFTRAYASATLEQIDDPENALLAALFISSHEDEESNKIWQRASASWQQRFKQERQENTEALALQLLCDGIWFAIMHEPGHLESIKKQTKEIVRRACRSLGGEEN